MQEHGCCSWKSIFLESMSWSKGCFFMHPVALPVGYGWHQGGYLWPLLSPRSFGTPSRAQDSFTLHTPGPPRMAQTLTRRTHVSTPLKAVSHVTQQRVLQCEHLPLDPRVLMRQLTCFAPKESLRKNKHNPLLRSI